MSVRLKMHQLCPDGPDIMPARSCGSFFLSDTD